MKHRSVLVLCLVATALGLLTACFRAPSPEVIEQEESLFTDADLFNAANGRGEFGVIEPGEAKSLEEATELDLELPEESDAEISTQGIQAGAAGYITFLQTGKNNAGKDAVSIWLSDQLTGERVRVYYTVAGDVTSAAVSADGNSVYFTGRPAGETQYDVYRLDIAADTATNETSDAGYDDSVTVSADGNVVVWEHRALAEGETDPKTSVARAEVRFRESSTNATTSIRTKYHNITPSVSADGGYIAFALPNSAGAANYSAEYLNKNNAIRFYEIATKEQTGVRASSRPLFDPSISKDAAKVAWMEVAEDGIERLRIRDVASNTISVGARSSGTIDLKTGSITSDPNYIVVEEYIGSSERSRVRTRNLTTGRFEVVAAADTTVGRFYVRPFWQITVNTVDEFIDPEIQGEEREIMRGVLSRMSADKRENVIYTLPNGTVYTNSANLKLEDHWTPLSVLPSGGGRIPFNDGSGISTQSATNLSSWYTCPSEATLFNEVKGGPYFQAIAKPAVELAKDGIEIRQADGTLGITYMSMNVKVPSDSDLDLNPNSNGGQAEFPYVFPGFSGSDYRGYGKKAEGGLQYNAPANGGRYQGWSAFQNVELGNAGGHEGRFYGPQEVTLEVWFGQGDGTATAKTDKIYQTPFNAVDNEFHVRISNANFTHISDQCSKGFSDCAGDTNSAHYVIPDVPTFDFANASEFTPILAVSIAQVIENFTSGASMSGVEVSNITLAGCEGPECQRQPWNPMNPSDPINLVPACATPGVEFEPVGDGVKVDFELCEDENNNGICDDEEGPVSSLEINPTTLMSMVPDYAACRGGTSGNQRLNLTSRIINKDSGEVVFEREHTGCNDAIQTYDLPPIEKNGDPIPYLAQVDTVQEGSGAFNTASMSQNILGRFEHGFTVIEGETSTWSPSCLTPSSDASYPEQLFCVTSGPDEILAVTDDGVALVFNQEGTENLYQIWERGEYLDIYGFEEGGDFAYILEDVEKTYKPRLRAMDITDDYRILMGVEDPFESSKCFIWQPEDPSDYYAGATLTDLDCEFKNGTSSTGEVSSAFQFINMFGEVAGLQKTKDYYGGGRTLEQPMAKSPQSAQMSQYADRYDFGPQYTGGRFVEVEGLNKNGVVAVNMIDIRRNLTEYEGDELWFPTNLSGDNAADLPRGSVKEVNLPVLNFSPAAYEVNTDLRHLNDRNEVAGSYSLGRYIETNEGRSSTLVEYDCYFYKLEDGTISTLVSTADAYSKNCEVGSLNNLSEMVGTVTVEEGGYLVTTPGNLASPDGVIHFLWNARGPYPEIIDLERASGIEINSFADLGLSGQGLDITDNGWIFTAGNVLTPILGGRVAE